MTAETAASIADKLPPEASCSGKNTVYKWCRPLDRFANYGVCLHTLNAHEAGRLSEELFGECMACINSGNCHAVTMRQEERDAGQALYFVERVERVPVARPRRDVALSSVRVDTSSESYQRGRQGHSPKPKAPSPAPDKLTLQQVEQQTSLSSLVEEIAQETKPKPAKSTTPAKAPSPTPAIKPEPGESPLAFARRRAALLAQAKEAAHG